MAKIKNNADVIIVGAGLAGLTLALRLARAGIETIVLEKGLRAGTKNFFSGVVCKETLEDVFGKDRDMLQHISAVPIERTVTESRVYLLQEGSFNKSSVNGFTILREPFINWMSREVGKARASILYGQVVRELIVDKGKIVGVKTDKSEFFSNVVVLAEGVNSLLTKKTGLRKGELTPDQVFLFGEENIALSSELIEERLNLEQGQGIAAKLVTHKIFDMLSIGYFNTNKNSISLGTGILLSESISKNINVNQCHEELKQHSAIKPLISGGITNNYISYMLPASVGGCNGIPLPRIYVNGCLLVGGAATLVNPFSLDLAGLAIISSKLAAETIIKAKELNDFSENVLSSYGKLIKEQIIEPRNSKPQSINDQSIDFNSKMLNDLESFVLSKK